MTQKEFKLKLTVLLCFGRKPKMVFMLEEKIILTIKNCNKIEKFKTILVKSFKCDNVSTFI